MSRRRPVPMVERRARRTVRIVCEGYAEVNVVRHLRSLYLSGRAGHALSDKNAHGGGGRRALELALSPRVRIGVDVIAILIDTDKDWDVTLRQKAAERGVQVLESAPCLEAWLLRVAGHRPPGTTAACKQAFHAAFGGDAHHDQVLPRHFSRAVLDASRADVPVLDQLLRLIGV